jgi:hypothetical protein
VVKGRRRQGKAARFEGDEGGYLMVASKQARMRRQRRQGIAATRIVEGGALKAHIPKDHRVGEMTDL